MHLTLRVLGLELLDLHLTTGDEPGGFDGDETGHYMGFAPPPAVPAFTDMPDREV